MSDGGGDAHSINSVSGNDENAPAPASAVSAMRPYVPHPYDGHSGRRAGSPLSISGDEAENVSENNENPVSENNENQNSCVICYSPVNTPPLSCKYPLPRARAAFVAALRGLVVLPRVARTHGAPQDAYRIG